MEMEQAFFADLCLEYGIDLDNDVEVVSEYEPPSTKIRRLGYYSQNSERAQKVADVGREIIRAARVHVRQEYNQSIEKAKVEIDATNLTEEEVMKKINDDFDVEFWLHAIERIEGYTKNGIQNWAYILLHAPEPNAFVSELLPQRVFVTTGLFEEFAENDDELALILGHELSHLIMGHATTNNGLDALMRGLEVLILALDPTEGFLSVGIIGVLAGVRKIFMASYSREYETEADELGTKLAAMACYDTTRGVEVFRKMHEYALRYDGHGKSNMLSSHPASLERYENTKQLSISESRLRYTNCHEMKERMRRALTLETG